MRVYIQDCQSLTPFFSSLAHGNSQFNTCFKILKTNENFIKCRHGKKKTYDSPSTQSFGFFFVLCLLFINLNQYHFYNSNVHTHGVQAVGLITRIEL